MTEQVVDGLISDAKLRSEGVDVCLEPGKDASIDEVYQSLIRDLRLMESRYHQRPDAFVFSEADASVASKAADMLELMLFVMEKSEERYLYKISALEDKHRREDCSHMDVRAPSLNW